jgi:hypothetical protein
LQEGERIGELYLLHVAVNGFVLPKKIMKNQKHLKIVLKAAGCKNEAAHEKRESVSR